MAGERPECLVCGAVDYLHRRGWPAGSGSALRRPRRRAASAWPR